MNRSPCLKLNVLAMGISFAIFLSLALFLTAWWIMLFDGATGEPGPLASFYRGYTISPMGSVIGLAWGLGDGFIDGVVFAWLYNFAVERLTSRQATPEETT